jgi:fucose permease
MARDGRQLAAVGAFGGLVLFAASANIVFAALPRMSQTFGVAAGNLANATAVQFSGFVLASVIGGMVADRVGKRRVLLAGATLVAVGAAVWASAARLPGVFAGAFVMGLGGGVLESMCTALLIDVFPTRRRLLLNLSQVAYCVGAVGGPVLMSWLLPQGVSWRLFFSATAAGSVVLGFVFLGLRHGGAPSVAATLAAGARRGPRLGLSVWLPCIAIFCYVTAETGTATYLTLYLAQAKAAPERWAIAGLALFWGTMLVGRLLCALLPEEHPHERVIALLLAAAAGCSLAHLGNLGWRGDLWLFALTGLACAGSWPLIVGLAAARHPRQTGTVVGLVAGIGSVGCILAPPLLRPLIAGARPAAAFALVGMLLLLAAGLILIPCPGSETAEEAPHGDPT